MVTKPAAEKVSKKSIDTAPAKSLPKSLSKSLPKSRSAATKGKPASAKDIPTDSTRSWYDYPELYELGFLKETPKESKFLEAVFKKHVPFPVKRVLEAGCGSGRLIVDMAARGFDMTGLDLNKHAMAYCKEKLQQAGNHAELVIGDMTKFHFDEPFDAAVNAINTFRHLETEDAALAHLNCVADNLKPGGVFVLSLHLLPTDGDLWGTERWRAKQGDLSVSYALTVVETSMKTRLEKLRISMLVRNGNEAFRLSDHISLRIYTAEQLKKLLAKAKKLQLVGVYDFWYDIKSRRRLTGNTCDVILVLKRI